MSDSYHFIGIGGIGMSGLARLLLSQNIPVSGSDIALSATVESLIREGAVSSRFRSQNSGWASPLTQSCQRWPCTWAMAVLAGWLGRY